MKLIIAGGRDYLLSESDYQKLDAIHRETPVTEVVSGKATGADACGEKWAKWNKIPIKGFPADWAKHGKAAGPIRNEAMARHAEAVALFPGGKGTQNMRLTAISHNLRVFNFIPTEPSLTQSMLL